MNDILVDSDFVRDKIGKPGWVIVDLRFADDYNKGHIPSAVGLPGWLSKIFAEDTKRQATVLARIAQTLGEIGIDNDSHVIVYGDPANAHWGAVIFWIFEAIGCNSSKHNGTVQFYDGGINRWMSDGGDIDQTKPSITPKTFKAIAARRGAGADEMLRIVEGEQKAAIIDVRSPGEYGGTDVRALRGGHIPGSVNIDFKKNFDTQTFMMLPLDQLQPLYKDINKDQRVIVYCQTGARASYTHLVLRALGYQDVANYHDGWRVYGSDLKFPVEDETWFDFTKVNVMMKTISNLS